MTSVVCHRSTSEGGASSSPAKGLPPQGGHVRVLVADELVIVVVIDIEVVVAFGSVVVLLELELLVLVVVEPVLVVVLEMVVEVFDKVMVVEMVVLVAEVVVVIVVLVVTSYMVTEGGETLCTATSYCPKNLTFNIVCHHDACRIDSVANAADISR
eukprot:CAMPEP_0177405162 /NCGR_PEP_ID=MMETSP0368-20130122/61811_1 /TAXON_ID=447022 ORGANISM="Scrippsiella hangoei-like, Strain SHHI-4" /NCGR_SAMPLE_ID=MMETSP0368 /ASSEMBLY_ACC=CAM_ASM_000363 /LENGTH=155 /DNA_ID=CAMNT_0018873341 /DNA_START=239 /DNA_END=705 /DNA_ORIENTATION=-